VSVGLCEAWFVRKAAGSCKLSRVNADGVFWRDRSGPPFYVTGDAQDWVQFDQAYSIGIEPIYGTAKMAPRMLADLQKEREETQGQPEPRVTATELLEPTPNPFNPRVEIGFRLARAEDVELAIFDIRGRKVATVLSERLPHGRHAVIWGGTDARGREVASGVYFARFQAGGLVAMKRLALHR